MELSIAAIIIAIAGVLFTYFRFILRTEHRLTRLETQLEFIPSNELFKIISGLLKKIPPTSSNPEGARRTELMQRLERRELTYPEARELQELVKKDVEHSSEDELIKGLILVGLGMLIGYSLSKLLK